MSEPAGIETPPICGTCDGCGQVDDSMSAPWSMWENLPVKSALAMIVGLVKPITCPDCGGTGISGGRP